MRSPIRRLSASLLTLAALSMGACEDEVTAPDDDFTEGEISLDASDPALFTYLTFADGGSVVTVTDPSTSTEWDMALRRFSVKLNGGVAGPGDAAGANLLNNGDATAEEVAAFTQDDGNDAFDAASDADIAGATFVQDGLIEDMTGPWFRFDPMAGNLVANPGAAWKVRESDGGYSIFRVSELVMAGETPESVTLEFRHQDAGGSLGDIESVEVDLTMGPGWVDLAGATTVTPDACNWDVTVTPFFSIDFNEDCDAGTFPLDPAEDFTAIEQADDAPEYAPYLSVISGAFPSTVDDATGVFWYNIEGTNRMWPTYNVFLVRVDGDVYKVQIIDYYDAGGASGFPTVRFEQIQ